MAPRVGRCGGSHHPRCRGRCASPSRCDGETDPKQSPRDNIDGDRAGGARAAVAPAARRPGWGSRSDVATELFSHPRTVSYRVRRFARAPRRAARRPRYEVRAAAGPRRTSSGTDHFALFETGRRRPHSLLGSDLDPVAAHRRRLCPMRAGDANLSLLPRFAPAVRACVGGTAPSPGGQGGGASPCLLDISAQSAHFTTGPQWSTLVSPGERPSPGSERRCAVTATVTRFRGHARSVRTSARGGAHRDRGPAGAHH